MISVSIITATYNASATLKSCLESVAAQNRAVEHIIIDGASTDNTLEIIRQPEFRVDHVISEPDQGLYHAMNKGLGLATGEVVGTLNADDMYADPYVMDRVSRVFEKKGMDSCYGDLVYVDSQDVDRVIRYWRSGQFAPSRFYFGWMPPHPTFFVRREIYEKYGGFNTELQTAADYELMLRFLFRHRISTAYIPHILIKMRTGGVSNASLKNRLQANRMDRKAWKVNGLKPYPWTLWLKPIRKIGQYLRRVKAEG